MKKLAALFLILALALSLSCVAYADALPAPEPDETNMFGVDKNINMKTLDEYLNCLTRQIMRQSVEMLTWPLR